MRETEKSVCWLGKQTGQRGVLLIINLTYHTRWYYRYRKCTVSPNSISLPTWVSLTFSSDQYVLSTGTNLGSIGTAPTTRTYSTAETNMGQSLLITWKTSRVGRHVFAGDWNKKNSISAFYPASGKLPPPRCLQFLRAVKASLLYITWWIISSCGVWPWKYGSLAPSVIPWVPSSGSFEIIHVHVHAPGLSPPHVCVPGLSPSPILLQHGIGD